MQFDARRRELLYGIRQLLREENSCQYRQQRRDETDPENLPAHVRNRREGRSLILNRDHAES